jgi:hypothetical protein
VLVKDEHTRNNLENALPEISMAGLFSFIIPSRPPITHCHDLRDANLHRMGDVGDWRQDQHQPNFVAHHF